MRYSLSILMLTLCLLAHSTWAADAKVPFRFQNLAPGDSLDALKKAPFFKTCKKDPELRKSWNASELWACIAPETGVSLTVFSIFENKIARMQIYFGEKLSAKEGGAMIGNASFDSLNLSKMEPAQIVKSFGPPMRQDPHMAGMDPVRDIPCGDGTNELKCKVTGWKSETPKGFAFMFTNHSPKQKKETVGALFLEDSALLKAMRDH